MKTMRKCPNCQMNTSKQIAEGITHRKWYRYFECTECKRIQSYQINKPVISETGRNPINSAILETESKTLSKLSSIRFQLFLKLFYLL